RRDTFTSYEDLAVLCKRYILTGNNLTKRARSCIEWMIHSNNRTGFRQPITLNDRKAEMFPELLKVRIDFRASYDKHPELPPEVRMNLAVSPQPSHHTVRSLVGSSFLGKSLDLVSQVLENSWDTHDY